MTKIQNKTKRKVIHSVSESGYAMKKCASCGSEFVHLTTHRKTCSIKRIEEGMLEKFFFPNDVEPHEAKCGLCYLILVKKNLKRHESKHCKVLPLLDKYHEGGISLEELILSVEKIREKNFYKERCNFCLRRLTGRYMKGHQKTCTDRIEYIRFRNYYHFGLRYRICLRYEMFRKENFELKARRHRILRIVERVKSKIFYRKLQEERNRINPNEYSKELPSIYIRKDPDEYYPSVWVNLMNFDYREHYQKHGSKRPTKIVPKSEISPLLSQEEFEKQYKESIRNYQYKTDKELIRKLRRNTGYIYYHQDKNLQRQFAVVYTSELDGSITHTQYFNKPEDLQMHTFNENT